MEYRTSISNSKGNSPPDSWRSILISVALIYSLLAAQSPCRADEGPRLEVQNGHTSAISSMSFSSDGKILATGSWDSLLKLWDANTGKKFTEVGSERFFIRAVACSPTAPMVITGSDDCHLRAWSFDRAPLWDFDAKASIIGLCFSVDGHFVMCAASQNAIQILDARTGEKVKSLTVEEKVTAVAWGRDRFAVGHDDGSIEVWNTANDSREQRLLQHKNTISSLAISPDGERLVAASHDNTCTLWNLKTGTLIQRLSGHLNFVYAAAFSLDGSVIASGSADGTWKIWDGKTGSPLYSWLNYSPVMSLAFSPSGKTIAVGGVTGGINIYDIDTGKPLHYLSNPQYDLKAMSVSPDGTYLATATGCSARLWNFRAGTVETRVGHTDSVRCISFAKDGKHFATGSDDKTIRVWSTETNNVPPTIMTGHKNSVTALSFSPDSKVLISGSSDKTLRSWSVVDGKLLKIVSTETEGIKSVDFNPDGQSFCCSSKAISIWSARSYKKVKILDREAFGVPRFSPDSLSIATEGYPDPSDYSLPRSSYMYTVRLWDLKTGQCKKIFRGHSDRINDIAFSQDGNLLISGSWDRSVRVWNCETGQQVHAFTGHSGQTNSVSFLGAGPYAVSSGSHDGLVRLWNIPKKAELCALSSYGKNDWIVATPEGRFDASQLDDIRSLAWVLPSDPHKAYPIEIFFRQYYEPNLLSKLFAQRPLSAIPTLQAISKSVPKAQIKHIKPVDGVDDEVEVLVSYLSQSEESGSNRSGVHDLRLFRDGKLVGYLPEQQSFSQMSEDLSGGRDDETSTSFRVKLPHNGASDYSFMTYAFNHDRVKGQSSTLIFTPSKTLEKRKGRVVIIAFGADTYDDQNWNLRYAAADANSYQTELVPILKASNEYQEVECKILTSISPEQKNATKDNLRALISGLRSLVPDDSLIISFSCHGAADEKSGEYYLFGSDIGVHSEGADLFAHGISSTELTDWIRDIDAGQIVVIIDACHSGAASGLEFKPGPMDNPGLGQLAYYKKMRILSASQASSKAKEVSKLGHGLLTFVLLEEGLSDRSQSDCGPKDGILTMSELLNFAQHEVPRLDRKTSRTDTVAEKRSFSVERTEIYSADVQTPRLLDFSVQPDSWILRRGGL